MLILNSKNKINVFAFMKSIKSLSLLGALLLSSNVIASSLTGVKFNTIQNDEIELVFSLSDVISVQPIVKTSLSPAKIDITFDADSFDQNIANIDVSHAGVKTIKLKKIAGKIVATVDLEALSVFDVSQVDNTFSIVLNKGLSSSPITKITPIGGDFINNIDSIDFRKNEANQGQLLIYLADSMVAVDVRDRLGKLYIEFHNTEIMEDLLYKLDVTDFGTIVTGIETFKDGRNARLVVDITGEYQFEHKQDNNIFIRVFILR